MPVIAPTKISSIGAVTAVETTLNGTDTFVYKQGITRFLILRNPTGSAITPVVDGAGATSEYLPGYGNVSTAAGFSAGAIAAGTTRVVDLTNINAFLKGEIAVTSGTGLVAILAEI